MNLEKMIEQLTNEELKQCFDEYVEWRKTGVLVEKSLIRKLWKQYNETVPHYPIHAMNEPILYEIAKRVYQ